MKITINNFFMYSIIKGGNSMKKKEVIFTIIISILYFIFILNREGEQPIINYLGHIIYIWIDIILISLIRNDTEKYDEDFIYSNKKAIIAFAILYIYLILTNILSNNKSQVNNISLYETKISYIIYPIIMIGVVYGILLISMKMLKIDIKNFKFKIGIKELLLVILLIAIKKVIECSFLGIDMLTNGREVFYIFINFVINLISPAFIEEMIFRGLLMSGLKGFNFKIENANIIQAVLFGSIHYFYYTQYGIIGILGISFQAIVGYMLGKLYIKTKSLTPCIVLHALINTI